MQNHSLPISISSTISAIELVPLSRVPYESMQHLSREFLELFSQKGYALAIDVILYSMMH